MTKKISEGFAPSQATVTTAASKVVSSGARDTVTLYNRGSVDVFIGASAAVTSSTGFPIPAGGALTLENTQDIYAIAASGTVALAILVEA
jgi:uncharacterized protein (DUF2345 family)